MVLYALNTELSVLEENYYEEGDKLILSDIEQSKLLSAIEENERENIFYNQFQKFSIINTSIARFITNLESDISYHQHQSDNDIGAIRINEIESEKEKPLDYLFLNEFKDTDFVNSLPSGLHWCRIYNICYMEGELTLEFIRIYFENTSGEKFYIDVKFSNDKDKYIQPIYESYSSH